MARNIRYTTANDANGGSYTWLSVHRSLNHNPYSFRPSAAYDAFIPSFVYLPFASWMPYYDINVVNALSDPNVHEVAQDPVNGPVEDVARKVGLGDFPYPNNRLDRITGRVPSNYFIKTSSIGDFDLRNYTAKGESTPNNPGNPKTQLTSLNYFMGTRHTGTSWDLGDTTQGGVPLTDAIRAIHPTAGSVEQWAGFLSGAFAPADASQVVVRSNVDYANNHGPNDMTWIAFDPHDRVWKTSDSTFRPFFTLDGTVNTFHPATSTNDITVKRYGDSFYDISVTISFDLATGDMAFSTNNRTSGSTYYKAKFPHKQSDNTPLRYVRFHRPQHSANPSSATNLAAPLSANSGFTFTVCSDDFTERVILDNTLDDAQRVLLFGDRTLVDLGDDGSTNLSVDARRLKLPTPTIEDSCRVTLPWNNEVIQFDRANDQYDFGICTADLLTYKTKIFGKNSSSSKEVWSMLSTDSVKVYVEYGIIARTIHFNGRFPYVDQTHTSTSF